MKDKPIARSYRNAAWQSRAAGACFTEPEIPGPKAWKFADFEFVLDSCFERAQDSEQKIWGSKRAPEKS